MSDLQALLAQLDAIRSACSDEDYARADRLLADYDAAVRALQPPSGSERDTYALILAQQQLLGAQIAHWRAQAQTALSDLQRGARSRNAYLAGRGE